MNHVPQWIFQPGFFTHAKQLVTTRIEIIGIKITIPILLDPRRTISTIRGMKTDIEPYRVL